jgi:hypothetical protein
VPGTFDEFVSALYQTSPQTFVAKRKRLAAELKATGDEAGAARLGKLARPTISAWAINQLYFRAREAFDELMETAERVRGGELEALAAHRAVASQLRAQAADLLRDAGHSANEATQRRIATTLAALSAAGGFEPDLPGALSTDRDPPGFDAGQMALDALPSEGDEARGPARTRDEPAPEADASARERERRREEEREKRRGERERLE